uniref:Diguanylate cyclase/phosphodiesterase with PAS sensor n=1 Tax=Magnetococcus massalia (strain MO-1) TaxID=451514 RepID=A0A1S7LI62_MAGMO|nr:Diguanylate cyclase/phosphodiesterase with PAS sensor [Candidatus Magnetococcus massalia]
MALRRSKVVLPLLGGFVVFLLSLAGVWLHNYYASEQLFKTMQSSETVVRKMHLVSDLMEVARVRTRILAQMLDEEDSFANDEHIIRLNREAGYFIEQRNKLLTFPLDQVEKSILEKQRNTIPPIIKAMDEVTQIVMWEDEEEAKARARKIHYDIVLPGQGKVVDHFMRLQAHLEKQITRVTQASINSHRKHLNQQLAVLILAVLLILMVMFVTIRRITRIETLLHFEKERAQITLISIADGVITTDSQGVIQDANQAVGHLINRQPNELLGCTLEEILPTQGHAEESPALHEYLQELLGCEECMPVNTLATLGEGDKQIILDATLSPVRNDQREVLGSVITMKDITEKHRLAERINYQARHDQLTGLFNRHSFSDLCRTSMEQMKEGDVHTLCIIDLDRFKTVNDTCGHKAGDAALKEISEMIQNHIRKHDHAARIGGDEFTIFLEDCKQEQANVVMDKLLDEIKAYRFVWSGQSFTLGFSIGICEIHPHIHFEKSFQAADAACFEAKDAGRMCIRNGHVDESEESEEKPTKAGEVSWLPRLQSAMEENRIVIALQPLEVNGDEANQGQLYEVFMRLKEGDKLHPPMAFLPTAERHGLTGQLDQKVLGCVIDCLKKDPEGGNRYSINLAPKTLEDPSAVEGIIQALQAHPDEARRICFEIDECAIFNNIKQASTLLKLLVDAGAMTAMDNYSGSLGNCTAMEALPLDLLKVDGALIQQSVERPTPRAIVSSIHAISLTMGLRTVAKQVESQEQVDMLRQMGFNYLQGFHIAKPEVREK